MIHIDSSVQKLRKATYQVIEGVFSEELGRLSEVGLANVTTAAHHTTVVIHVRAESGNRETENYLRLNQHILLGSFLL